MPKNSVEYEPTMQVEIRTGLMLRVLRLATPLQLKQQAWRPQDLADIAELRNLQGQEG